MRGTTPDGGNESGGDGSNESGESYDNAKAPGPFESGQYISGIGADMLSVELSQILSGQQSPKEVPDGETNDTAVGGREGPTAYLLGYKRGGVVFKLARDDRAIISGGFRAHAQPTTYQTHDTAVCVHGRSHKVPAEDCTCGFYALKDKQAITERKFRGAAAQSRRYSSAVLTVVLYGDAVIEGEAGYRGANQSVLSVEMPGNCRVCLNKADIFVEGDRISSEMDGDTHWIDSMCTTCADEHGFSQESRFSQADVSGILGTDVMFGEVREYSARLRKVLIAQQSPPAAKRGISIPGSSIQTVAGLVWFNAFVLMPVLLLWLVLLRFILIGGTVVQPLSGDEWLAVGTFGALWLLLFVVSFIMARHSNQTNSKRSNSYVLVVSILAIIPAGLAVGMLFPRSAGVDVVSSVAGAQQALEIGDGTALLYDVQQILGEDVADLGREGLDVATMQTLLDGHGLDVTVVEGPVSDAGEIGVAYTAPSEGNEQTYSLFGMATPHGENGCAWRQVISMSGDGAPYGIGADAEEVVGTQCDPAAAAAFIDGYRDGTLKANYAINPTPGPATSD